MRDQVRQILVHTEVLCSAQEDEMFFEVAIPRGLWHQATAQGANILRPTNYPAQGLAVGTLEREGFTEQLACPFERIGKREWG